jgi:ATP-dependent DNA helicase RecG
MDPDILRVSDRLAIAIELGESHFREFKSAFEGPPNNRKPRDPKAVCEDIAKTLVAFANADGGELLIGVEDGRDVTGLSYKPEVIEMLRRAPNTHVHKDTPLPQPHTVLVDYKGERVLYFSVPKGAKYVHLTSEGKCLQRKDLESVPIPSEQITLSRAEVTSREYDRSFVDSAQVSDLDQVLVAKVAADIANGISNEKLLQHLELAEFDGYQLKLRRAALLLFAHQPNKWHPRLQVRVLQIKGTELKTGESYNVLVDEEVTTNIVSLVEASWELLRPHLTETRFSKDAVFRSQIMYPELACREALVNAIAHRDYSIEGRGIEVRVYTDRLEIISPGGLVSAIKLEDLSRLRGLHQSRNSLVSRVLREIGYMRELGEGMRRMFELMKSNDLTPPDLFADNNVFSITLHHKYTYTRDQKLWLDAFANCNLTREQKTVVLLGHNKHVISPKEIWDAVGIVDTEIYRQLLESLVRLGILETVRSKPSASNYAKKQNIPVKHVPRFAIHLPGVPRPSDKHSTSEADRQSPPRPRNPPQASSTPPLRAVRAALDDKSDYSRVFVANLPQDSSENDLMKAMATYGTVVDVKIPKDPGTNCVKGFGFVEYDKSSEAASAIGASGTIELGGRYLTIRRAVPKVTVTSRRRGSNRGQVRPR